MNELKILEHRVTALEANMLALIHEVDRLVTFLLQGAIYERDTHQAAREPSSSASKPG